MMMQAQKYATNPLRNSLLPAVKRITGPDMAINKPLQKSCREVVLSTQ